MSHCPKCAETARELKREKKRSTILSDTLINIYHTARDKMWYPSTFEERGESGFKSQKAFVDADLRAMKPPVEDEK